MKFSLLKTKTKLKPVLNSIIINVSNLSFSFNDNLIFDNISFSIKKGDMVAIIGPNGAGKSTLVKLLIGFLKPNNQKNKINFKIKKNKDKDKNKDKFRNSNLNVLGRVSYIPQKYNQDSNFPAKVKELLDLECCKCNLRDNVVSSLNISSLENSQFKDLSGGQQQRVLIAVALLSNPDILILDEPTVGIDTDSQMGFYNILKDLNTSRNLTILFITHDTSMISNYFNKTLCVYDKKICLDDAKNSHQSLHKMYGCNFHEIKHNHNNNHGGNLN